MVGLRVANQRELAMEPTCELARRYGELPLRLLVQHARVTRSLVATATRRWSAGRRLPDDCRPDRVFQLACQAEVAELVAGRRIIALPVLPVTAGDRRTVAHGPN
jgi:hypothetical protein